MELKKNDTVNLERRKALLLAVGLVLSLSIVLMAFEWKSFDNGELMDFGPLDDNFEELTEIPQTEQPPPEKPKIQQPQLIEIPDDEEIEDEIEIDLDVDISDETEIENIVFEDEPEDEVADEVFIIVEERASFPGDNQAWGKFLRKNLKYPKNAKRMGIEGSVFLSFTVDQEGKVSDIQVDRGLSGGCNEEAIRVLQKSPRWNPGKQRGVPVKSRMQIRIRFRLK